VVGQALQVHLARVQLGEIALAEMVEDEADHAAICGGEIDHPVSPSE